jgi:hypothetical protein
MRSHLLYWFFQAPLLRFGAMNEVERQWRVAMHLKPSLSLL